MMCMLRNDPFWPAFAASFPMLRTWQPMKPFARRFVDDVGHGTRR